MKVNSRVLGLCGLLIVQCVFSSCMAAFSDTKVGVELDKARLGEITPGTTTFSDILEWFGPPDYIIDGTQQIVDSTGLAGIVPGEDTIPTRTFTAPPGTVICIYRRTRYKLSAAFGMVPVIAVGGSIDKTSVRDNELFVYISKKDRRVIEFIAGPGQGEGASR